MWPLPFVILPLCNCSYVMNSHLVVKPWAIFEFSTTMDLVRPSSFRFRLVCLRVMLLESSWATFHEVGDDVSLYISAHTPSHMPL